MATTMRLSKRSIEFSDDDLARIGAWYLAMAMPSDVLVRTSSGLKKWIAFLQSGGEKVTPNEARRIIVGLRKRGLLPRLGLRFKKETA